MRDLLKRLASVRLAVALLTFSMVLIFVATIAQVKTGIWETQKVYFESFFIYATVDGFKIPVFPGGYTIGSLLLINLIGAFIARFQLKAMKAGVYMIHSGLVLILVSELLTDFLSVESQMMIPEGGRINYSQTSRNNELVFIDRNSPNHDTIHSIPVSMLKPDRVIDVSNGPLKIKVVAYYPNARLGRGKENQQQELATQGAGVKMNLIATPKAIDYSDNTTNVATAYIEVIGPDGSLGTWLVSNVIDDRYPPQKVVAGKQEWEIALRYKRHYYPFEMELLDFSHDKYPGTKIPFNYSSKVIAHHNDHARNQQALIYMNNPLRYEGLTFYQASFSPDETATILQVVRNPGWMLPYLSVTLIFLGMFIQFGLHFWKFLSQRRP